MELSESIRQKTESPYEIKKQLAFRFAETLKKNGIMMDNDVFVQRLIAYSKQRGVKHITKLKVVDIEKCMNIIHNVEC